MLELLRIMTSKQVAREHVQRTADTRTTSRRLSSGNPSDACAIELILYGLRESSRALCFAGWRGWEDEDGDEGDEVGNWAGAGDLAGSRSCRVDSSAQSVHANRAQLTRREEVEARLKVAAASGLDELANSRRRRVLAVEFRFESLERAG